MIAPAAPDLSWWKEERSVSGTVTISIVPSRVPGIAQSVRTTFRVNSAEFTCAIGGARRIQVREPIARIATFSATCISSWWERFLFDFLFFVGYWSVQLSTRDGRLLRLRCQFRERAQADFAATRLNELLDEFQRGRVHSDEPYRS